MADCTPTTAEVRERYINDTAFSLRPPRERCREFDRWLAQHDAEVRAAALEGHLLIPVPQVAPLGVPVDKPEFVQEVWDAFIKPRQDSGELQSAEERVLMAILRAVYAGLGGE